MSRKGGFNAVQIRIVLPDGRTYGQIGKLNFVDNTIGVDTDTITLRGTIPNPPLPQQQGVSTVVRELYRRRIRAGAARGRAAGRAPGGPRAAVLTDQQGDYVYVVGDDNKAMRADRQARPVDADRGVGPRRA